MPQRVYRRNAWCLGTLATAFGATIIACHIESGSLRWSASAWAFALEVPGSPATWGAVALLAGALVLYGNAKRHRRSRLWGCWIAFIWFCSLAVAALTTFVADLASDNPTVNPLAFITWTTFAAMFRMQIQDERALPAP